MREELRVISPRGLGIRKKVSVMLAVLYAKALTSKPMIALAEKKSEGSGDATDTGVKEVTDGIDVIKELVLGCVGGVGVIFLAWGLLDFGTGYSSHDTTQQCQAIKKVMGGLIMIAVPAILKLLGVS